MKAYQKLALFVHAHDLAKEGNEKGHLAAIRKITDGMNDGPFHYIISNLWLDISDSTRDKLVLVFTHDRKEFKISVKACLVEEYQILGVEKESNLYYILRALLNQNA